jgi:hypothetical protein
MGSQFSNHKTFLDDLFHGFSDHKMSRRNGFTVPNTKIFLDERLHGFELFKKNKFKVFLSLNVPVEWVHYFPPMNYFQEEWVHGKSGACGFEKPLSVHGTELQTDALRTFPNRIILNF